MSKGKTSLQKEAFPGGVCVWGPPMLPKAGVRDIKACSLFYSALWWILLTPSWEMGPGYRLGPSFAFS